MKTFLKILGVTSALALASSAYAADSDATNKTTYEAKDNGGYKVESTAKVTTDNGTDKKGMRKVDVDVKDNGKMSKETKTEKMADPKGMMNAKKDVSKTTFKDKDNGGYKADTMTEHKDADGTDTSTEMKADVDVNDDGSMDKTMEKTTTTDPKGLFNKTKTTTKIKNGEVVK